MNIDIDIAMSCSYILLLKDLLRLHTFMCCILDFMNMDTSI